MVLKLFSCFVDFNLNKQEHAALMELLRKCSKIYAEDLCLKALKRPFEHCIDDSLDNDQRVCIGDFFSNAYRIADHFGKCPNKRGDQIGALPSRSIAHRKQEGPTQLIAHRVSTCLKGQ